jgi:hypothetical protein
MSPDTITFALHKANSVSVSQTSGAQMSFIDRSYSSQEEKYVRLI